MSDEKPQTFEVHPRFKSTKKKPKTPTKTQQMRRCDTLFGQIIRLPGRCYICGSTEVIQCAHGFSRSYRATRWDERNAWCLCRRHHMYFTQKPLEWDDWMRSEMGEALYAEVRTLATTGRNPDYSETLARLQARLAAAEGRSA